MSSGRMTDEKYVTMSQHMAKSRHSREGYRNPKTQAVTVNVFRIPTANVLQPTIHPPSLHAAPSNERHVKEPKLHLFQER